MPTPAADRIRSLVGQAALDARDAADRLYTLQLALRAAGEALPVEAPEVIALQRKAADLAEALHDIETRKGW